MQASDRFTIRSFTAVGTADLGGFTPAPRNQPFGWSIFIETDGNYEANLLGDFFGDGVMVDVTSFMTGGATITNAGPRVIAKPNFLPWNTRVNVTSVQATKHVRFASGF